MTHQITQFVLSHVETVIILLSVYSVLITSLSCIFFLMMDSESGFEDESGFHSFQSAYEKTKNELETAEKQIKMLEEAHKDIYDMGFKAGNLSAIKELGKSLIDDHELLKIKPATPQSDTDNFQKIYKKKFLTEENIAEISK